FSFMFVAPVLYVIHAFLTGISLFIAATMQWISGFGFSAGLVDMALSSRNPLATHWYMLILQGLVFFALYYVVFRFVITKFNLLTPGREAAMATNDTVDGYSENVSTDNKKDEKKSISSEARQYIAAIGGSDNLTGIDACITRLRLTVKDSAQVNDAYAKQIGASGVIRLNKESVQVIVGTRAELIANAMRDVLKEGPVAAAQAAAAPEAVKAKAQGNGNVVLTLVAPFDGEVVDLSAVPDEAFAGRVVGDGIAIKPESDTVYAPAAGTVVKIFDTNHAFCLETDNGAEIIVHMGIDTVNLNGNGFTRLIEEGAQVAAGDAVLKLDLAYLNEHAKSMISPVIISNIDDYDRVEIVAKGLVKANESELYHVIK
ncbi:MAG: glucose PTS transporter subunit IIA, partial [Morganella morganii]